MSRSFARRLLAVFLVLVVVSFAFEAASHWHNGYDDQQCQLCHFAHSISVDLSHGTLLPAPAQARCSETAAWVDLHLELVSHQLSSRAPPAPVLS